MLNDLRMTLTINQQEAQSGTVRAIQLPNGQQATITIPAGAYDGQLLWFPGHVKATEQREQDGTLFLTLSVHPTTAATLLVSQPATVNTVLTPSERAVRQETPLTPPSPPLYNFQQQGSGFATPAPTPNVQMKPLTGSKMMIILMVVSLILIIGSVGTIFAVHRVQAIAQADAVNATTTSEANDATSTAIVQGTVASTSSTATAQVQATAALVAVNPNPYGGGKLVLYDKLDGSSSETRYEWTGTQGCTFSNGALHVLDSDPQYLKSCGVPDSSTYQDFTIEVKATILSGDSAQIYFRGSTVLATGYSFAIDTTGFYQLVRLGSGTLTSNGYTTLLQGTSGAIARGYHQANTLVVVAQGSTISVYVNRQMLGSINDTNFSKGEMALVSSTYSNHSGSTEVAFSDLRIWQL